VTVDNVLALLVLVRSVALGDLVDAVCMDFFVGMVTEGVVFSVMMVGVEGIVEVVFTVVDGEGVASLMVTANPFF